jgi:acyl CoA:acetate/3-ketoacid CoA transferase beta subunit
VFEIDRKAGSAVLVEVAPGVTLDEIKAKTEAAYSVAPALG